MKLHLPSVLLTVGVLGLVALTSSQSPLLPTGYRIEYLPHPRDYVQITSGTPYTVPSGKLFVLTALGAINGVSGPTALVVDGTVQATVPSQAANPVCYPATAASGLTVAAGGVIEVSVGSPGSSRAWGYLASQ